MGQSVQTHCARPAPTTTECTTIWPATRRRGLCPRPPKPDSTPCTDTRRERLHHGGLRGGPVRPDPHDHSLPAGQQRVHERPGVRPGDGPVPAPAGARQHAVHRHRRQRLHHRGLRAGPVRPDPHDTPCPPDNNECTHDLACNPATGMCHAPAGARQHAVHRQRQQRLHDGGLRGGPVRPDAQTTVCPPDNNECTLDPPCNPPTGQCTHPPVADSTPCTDTRQQRVHGGGLRGGPVRPVAHRRAARRRRPLPVLRDQAEGVHDRHRRLGAGSVRPAHRDRPLRRTASARRRTRTARIPPRRPTPSTCTATWCRAPT